MDGMTMMVDSLLRRWGVDPTEFIGGIKSTMEVVKTFDARLQAIEAKLDRLLEMEEQRNGDIIPAGTGSATGGDFGASSYSGDRSSFGIIGTTDRNSGGI